MIIDELYSALFEAINNKEIEKINSLLTNENINLLKNSDIVKDERYQKLCFEGLNFDNRDIFLTLCAPALRLLECDDKSSIHANFVAQVFLPGLIKQMVWTQKTSLIDALITACIVDELKSFPSNQSKPNFNSIAKISMLVAAVEAYSDLLERKDHPGYRDALQLRNQHVGIIRHSLDYLLDLTPGEQLNKKVFLAMRQRILSACFAQGADSLVRELMNNDAYWLKADPIAKEQEKVFGAALSIIAVGRLDLLKKYLTETIFDQGFYTQLLKAAIINDKKDIFDYILCEFGGKITIQKILFLVNEARIHYDKNNHYFCCFLDCNWLDGNELERRTAQLKITAYAVISFEGSLSKLSEVLKNFTAEDMQLLRNVDSKLYDGFCEKLKNKYPRVFVSQMSDCAYGKVKEFISEFKSFIKLDDIQQQEIIFSFNNSGVYAQFMGEWRRKHGNNYTPSIELRFAKKDEKIEVIISKTTKLSLSQVESFCEKIKVLTEQIVSKLKPVTKKTDQFCQRKKFEDYKISDATKKQLRAEKRKVGEDKNQIEFRDRFFKLLQINDANSLFKEQPKEFFLRKQMIF